MNPFSTSSQYLTSVIADNSAIPEAILHFGFDTDLFALLLTSGIYLLLYLLLQSIGKVFSFLKGILHLLGQSVNSKNPLSNRFITLLQILLISHFLILMSNYFLSIEPSFVVNII